MEIKLQIDESLKLRLQKMMEKAGLSRYEELIANALAEFEWSIDQIEDGRVIAAFHEGANQYRELEMPVLDHIAANRVANQKTFTAQFEAEKHSSSLERAIADLDPDMPGDQSTGRSR